MNISIGHYKIENYDSVIELLKINTPKYFAPAEEFGLINYLTNELEDYFVVLNDTKIIGAGGVNYFENGNKARISWDMIHPDFQGKGIGRQLLQFRITHILSNHPTTTIEVRTSQHTWAFYGKSGFETTEIVKDYWARGFDLYHMVLNVK